MRMPPATRESPGIRDAQESRGLGDVYKRQVLTAAQHESDWPHNTSPYRPDWRARPAHPPDGPDKRPDRRQTSGINFACLVQLVQLVLLPVMKLLGDMETRAPKGPEFKGDIVLSGELWLPHGHTKPATREYQACHTRIPSLPHENTTPATREYHACRTRIPRLPHENSTPAT